MLRSIDRQLVDLLWNTNNTMFEINQLYRYKHREDARPLSLLPFTAQPVSVVVLEEHALNGMDLQVIQRLKKGEQAYCDTATTVINC